MDPDKKQDTAKSKPQPRDLPGRGFVLIISPPAPGQEGYKILQPCHAPGPGKTTE